MPERDALIIANATYQDERLQKLRAPSRDAEALERVLADPTIGNFRVEVQTDQPESALTRRLSRFFRNRGPDDLLLVHFSGHGVKDLNGDLYFATTDTDPDQLDATAIDAVWLKRAMNRSASKRIVMLLDCCYAGAFSRGMLARGTERVDYNEVFEGQGLGRMILMATDSIQYALEGREVAGDATPSVFTTAVVDALSGGAADRDGDGWVSVQELYTYVHEAVRAKTPGMSPRISAPESQGELLLARNPRGPRVELDEELLRAIADPKHWMRRGAVAELGRLLVGPNRSYAEAARVQLRALASDDSEEVRSAALTLLQPVSGPKPPPGPPLDPPLDPPDPPLDPEPDPTAHPPDAEHVRSQRKLQHERPILALSFSPRGTLVATVTSDGKLRVWDETDGTQLWVGEHSEDAVEVCWNDDGTKIASFAPSGSTVRVWDAVTGEPVANISQKSGITACAWGAEARLLVAGAGDGARIWDAMSGTEQVRLDRDGDVVAVAWSPDRQSVLTAGQNLVAVVWDAVHGGERLRLFHRRGLGISRPSIRQAAWSPDGHMIATSMSNTKVSLWDAETGRETQRLHTWAPTDQLAWSPDSMAIATLVPPPHRIAHVWEASSGQVRSSVTSNRLMVWTHDSARLVVDRSLAVYARQVIGETGDTQLLHGGAVIGLSRSPDQGWIRTAAVAADDRTVLTAQWDVRSNATSYWRSKLNKVYDRINAIARLMNANLDNRLAFPNSRIGLYSGLHESADVLDAMSEKDLRTHVQTFLRQSGAL